VMRNGLEPTVQCLFVTAVCMENVSSPMTVTVKSDGVAKDVMLPSARAASMELAPHPISVNVKFTMVVCTVPLPSVILTAPMVRVRLGMSATVRLDGLELCAPSPFAHQRAFMVSVFLPIPAAVRLVGRVLSVSLPFALHPVSMGLALLPRLAPVRLAMRELSVRHLCVLRHAHTAAVLRPTNAAATSTGKGPIVPFPFVPVAVVMVSVSQLISVLARAAGVAERVLCLSVKILVCMAPVLHLMSAAVLQVTRDPTVESVPVQQAVPMEPVTMELALARAAGLD